MTIDPKSSLFQAILAMDSYNRGYLSGVDLNVKDANGNIVQASDAIGRTLGAVTIYDTKGDAIAQNAGFYAIAYQYSDGSVTVSYRGTDQFLAAGDVGGDILNAYGVGAQSADVPQSRLAIEFYQSVAKAMQDTQTPDLYGANISVTGHSSGGGLAGLVGAIYHKTGVLLDNMAFQTAALNLTWTKGYTSDPDEPSSPLTAQYTGVKDGKTIYQLINGTVGPV